MENLFTHTDGHTWEDCSVCYCHEKAMPADLVAAARAAVEEGTIEGKMVFVDFGQSIITDLPGTYLVIPVDGKET